MIDGMTIHAAQQLTEALKHAGFSKMDMHRNAFLNRSIGKRMATRNQIAKAFWIMQEAKKFRIIFPAQNGQSQF